MSMGTKRRTYRITEQERERRRREGRVRAAQLHLPRRDPIGFLLSLSEEERHAKIDQLDEGQLTKLITVLATDVVKRATPSQLSAIEEALDRAEGARV